VGGFSCKIHALTDALGYPLRLILTPGQTADITQAEALVTSIPVKVLLADKGYDSQDFIDFLQEEGIEPLIPSRSNARQPRTYDKVVYKERHLIECFFNKIKHYRRVFSRFDKKALNFLSFLHFVSVLSWTR
jgi:transposase